MPRSITSAAFSRTVDGETQTCFAGLHDQRAAVRLRGDDRGGERERENRPHQLRSGLQSEDLGEPLVVAPLVDHLALDHARLDPRLSGQRVRGEHEQVAVLADLERALRLFEADRARRELSVTRLEREVARDAVAHERRRPGTTGTAGRGSRAAP